MKVRKYITRSGVAAVKQTEGALDAPLKPRQAPITLGWKKTLTQYTSYESNISSKSYNSDTEIYVKSGVKR